jgi:hypothetical protein
MDIDCSRVVSGDLEKFWANFLTIFVSDKAILAPPMINGGKY